MLILGQKLRPDLMLATTTGFTLLILLSSSYKLMVIRVGIVRRM